MELAFIFVGGFLFNSIQCYDSGSFESPYDGIEESHFYDMIIFSDIADIMKEFESNSIPIFDKLAKDESESDENVEDLLQEYQKYLDKEEKQRKDYMERTKLKNKVPLLRHERFSKTSFGNGGKYNDYLYKNSYKTKNPLNLFIPIDPKVNQYDNKQLATTLPHDSMELNTFKKMLLSEGSPLPSTFPKYPLNAPCCKNGQISCKQCMTAKDYSRGRLEPRVSLYSDEKKLCTEHKYTDLTDPEDTLNVRIKIDVQLPKLHEKLEKQQNVFMDGSNTKDFPLAIKMPTSYYDFPIPMNLFGYKRMSKLNPPPFHKITIHKKKKSKSTGGKKHRKKIITFHNIKLEPQQTYEPHFGKFNSSEGSVNENHRAVADLISTTTEVTETNFSSTSTICLDNVKHETQTEENIFLLVNISNNIVNDTEESNKTNNSIETDYTHAIFNATTENVVHVINKREVVSTNKTVTATNATATIETKAIELNKTVSHQKPVLKVTKILKDGVKKFDKTLMNEDELLYWPNSNGSRSKFVTKNITTIILENETKKAKITMTEETMRQNHTRALEKAIFGDVDWKDVDTIVPAFMSFIGKYMEGTLTFCSDSICHSMKCGHKVCHHRVCAPIDRFNNKGHCMGANNTDSVATMESVMDLPSNVAFEIVDILQDKMEGKLFGKVTLCISSKCITFAASKKMFIKSKCIVKELNPKRHCEGGELYLNPWSKIEKPNPQVIKFTSNGDVIKKNIPAKRFINIKKLTHSMKSHKSLGEFLRLEDSHVSWNSTTVLKEIHSLINAIYASKTYRPRDRLKILTHCNKKRTLCRFLSCPHIKDHCTLCEVIMNQSDNNSTTCENISTRFLFSQFNVFS